MLRMNNGLKVKTNSILPNYITLLCSIILITIITGKLYLEYLIPFIAFFCFLVKEKGVIRGCTGKNIFLLFGIFIAIQVMGLIKNLTIFSLKNIMTSGCMFLIIYTVLNGKVGIQKGYIKIYYVIACAAMFLLSKAEIITQNTTAGGMTFLSLLLIILMSEERYPSGKKGKGKYKTAVRLVVGMIPAIVFSFAVSARTALFVNLFLIVFYFLFSFFDFRARTYRNMFCIMVVAIIAGLVFYINIRNYSWYTALNAFSYQYFGKNIDSSRSYLWRTSLAELHGSDWIWGLGTGIRPFIPRYANSSFHNSFIQTLMQNGAVGLMCLIFIFGVIWNALAQIRERSTRALFMSAFIAVVAYNCMECCLLQNKAFLGMIQWIILAIGVRYAAAYEQENQKKYMKWKGI